MPNYISKIWRNKIEELNVFVSKGIESVLDITITKEGKEDIRNWINLDFQKNLKGNNEEFLKIINKLVAENKIKIRRNN